jgi:glyoxylase-like metal-dependent hydrolase (beta-lactamase superfamily II)
MTFSVQVLKMGECDVAGPEVFWMSHWHEWVTLHFWMVVIRGPGVTAIVNTGPPSDLADLNARWHAAFGTRGEMRREECERPLNALASLGVRPEDVTHVLVTPLQSYATANIQLFPNARVCLSKRGWIEDFHAEKFPMQVSRWHRIPRDTLQYLMFEGWERVQLLEDEDEVVPGLRALWVGVHHRSSMCYLVDTARGPVAISDCVFTYRNLEAGEPLGVQESLEEFHRACARIKRDSALFIPLYEPEVWRRHPGGRVA